MAFKPPVGFQALGGVAVLADNTWAAMQGKKKLKIEWETSAHSAYNSDAYKKELQETARKPGKVVRDNGNVDAAFAKGGKIVEAEYYVPLLAHASMEPPAALAVFHDGKIEAWAPTQNPQGAKEAIAGATGLEERRRHRQRDAARRRLRAQIVSGLCSGSRGACRKKPASP